MVNMAVIPTYAPQVFVANNGQEAIDAVTQRGMRTPGEPNSRNYFDCILMDQVGFVTPLPFRGLLTCITGNARQRWQRRDD